MTVDEEHSTIHGLEHQSRTLACIQGDSDRVAFLVGTQSLRSDNQVCLLEYDEDSPHVTRHNWSHRRGEIWHLATSPNDPKLISTCYSSVSSGKLSGGCALWHLEPNSSNAPGRIPDLTLLHSIVDSPAVSDSASPTSASPRVPEPLANISITTSFQWQPAQIGSSGKAMLVGDDKVVIFDTSGGGPRVESWTAVDGKVTPKLTFGSWSPHHGGRTLAIAHDAQIQGRDIRSLPEVAWSVDGVHAPVVRCVDFNPNRQYYMATCGDDCSIRIWDLRQPKQSLSTIRAAHSHWIWSVRFNPVHDQLLLSCSSDSRLVLHCAASLSSEAPSNGSEIMGPTSQQLNSSKGSHPEGSLESEDDMDERAGAAGLLADGVLKTYDDQHEDSVYCAEWSAGDAWVFASLSYDGRVIINKVPNVVKYTILNY